MAQIVWRNGYAYPVPGQDSNVMATHAAGKLSSYDGASLINLDRVLSAAESILNAPFHFQQVAFAHSSSLFPFTPNADLGDRWGPGCAEPDTPSGSVQQVPGLVWDCSHFAAIC